MGFFTTPRGAKKKARGLIDLQTFLSPGKGATPEGKAATSQNNGNMPSLALAPPLFHTINDTDHQLLKNPKGTTAARRNSLYAESISQSSSLDTSSSKFQVSTFGESFSDSTPMVARATEENHQSIPTNDAVTCKSETTSVEESLENIDEKDRRTNDNQLETVKLPFNGSDSVGSLRSISEDLLDPSQAPPSPTDSAGSAKNTASSFRSTQKRASLRSLTSPAQPQRSLPLRSASSPNQLQRVSSLRRNQQPTSPSFRTLVSPIQTQKTGSFRSTSSLQRTPSLKSDDETGSYIEEFVIDDETYYEEEIIEEEFELSLLESSALLLVQERKSVVKFDEFDEMQLTLHLDDYTDHELKKTWYKRTDYDTMIQEARQVALGEEQRQKQMQNDNGETEASSAVNFFHPSFKSELDARGLESWSPSGALQVRKIKESAIEAVWNEQHRQLESGIEDVEQLRQVYQTVSLQSQKEAELRGLADRQVVEKILQLEELSMSEEIIKRRRRNSILTKSKTFINRSVKAAGKVAIETGKRSARASVGAVTLDPKMLLEAIKVEKKKRESKQTKNQQRQTFKQPSMCAIAMKLEGSATSLSASELGGPMPTGETPPSSIREKGAAIAPLIKARADKLKILRVLPLPGTAKGYDHDQREKKLAERRRSSKKSGLATWEVNLAAGGKF
ncbi:hypothetical protein IV203_021922 [Nitzschia inconspicua]|uniref:Uncharacterized protein n=1 Tax=Nitzschia inconspicua TaxID=303405 RepID=A0A9K3KIV5_9STRA|nr:hypothetical protein IV203_021922 [Nitzschia inconspicua]